MHISILFLNQVLDFIKIDEINIKNKTLEKT